MGFPDVNLPFILHSNASENGLGAVLYQKQEKDIKIIAFTSRTLSPSDKRYNLYSGKLEFLALKWSITEQFRNYLYYALSSLVVTDNNPLTYINTTVKLNGTGQR